MSGILDRWINATARMQELRDRQMRGEEIDPLDEAWIARIDASIVLFLQGEDGR